LGFFELVFKVFEALNGRGIREFTTKIKSGVWGFFGIKHLYTHLPLQFSYGLLKNPKRKS
jgi:hypothetical protein